MCQLPTITHSFMIVVYVCRVDFMASWFVKDSQMERYYITPN